MGGAEAHGRLLPRALLPRHASVRVHYDWQGGRGGKRHYKAFHVGDVLGAPAICSRERGWGRELVIRLLLPQPKRLAQPVCIGFSSRMREHSIVCRRRGAYHTRVPIPPDLPGSKTERWEVDQDECGDAMAVADMHILFRVIDKVMADKMIPHSQVLP